MSLTRVLRRGRIAAERLMVDACTITRPGLEITDVWGHATPAPGTEIYAGKCRVQQQGMQAQDRAVGEARLLMVRLEIQLPISVTGLEPEDLVVITASVHDPDLPGRVFTIRDLAHGTHKTARRIGVVERTS